MKDEIKTDTDINKFIHEKVMGAKWYRANLECQLASVDHLRGLCWLYAEHIGASMVRRGYWVESDGNDTVDEGECDTKPYTDSVSDAFLAVEAMEKKGWNWGMDYITEQKTWSVQFNLVSNEYFSAESSESLSKGIALAIVEAIKGESE